MTPTKSVDDAIDALGVTVNRIADERNFYRRECNKLEDANAALTAEIAEAKADLVQDGELEKQLTEARAKIERLATLSVDLRRNLDMAADQAGFWGREANEAKAELARLRAPVRDSEFQSLAGWLERKSAGQNNNYAAVLSILTRLSSSLAEAKKEIENLTLTNGGIALTFAQQLDAAEARAEALTAALRELHGRRK